MAEFEQGVTTESPTVTEVDPGQAPPTPEQQPRTVPLDTFINERRSWQARTQDAERRVQDFQRQLDDLKRQQAAGQPATPEQRAELERAGDALLNIVANHPKLKGLTSLLDNADKLVNGYSSVEQLSERQFTNVLTTGDERIATFAKSAGLPSTPEYVNHFQTLVGAVIKAHPEAEARLRAGDLSVVDQACKYVADNLIGPVRQSATVSVAQSKLNASRIPRPLRNGGAPGPAARQPLTAENETEWRRGMHRDAMGAWEDAKTKG